MPRLLVDGTGLSPIAKGVGRYSYHIIDQLTRRLGKEWAMDVIVNRGVSPAFTGSLQPRYVQLASVPELVRGLAVIPALALLHRTDCVLIPMDIGAVTVGRPTLRVVHDIRELIDAAAGGKPRIVRRAVDRVKDYFCATNLRQSSVVVCNSKYMTGAATRHYKLDPKIVRTGYCGVDHRFYREDSVDAWSYWPMLSKWNGYVLTFATGDPRETAHLLPDVWAIFRQQLQGIGLVVAGVREEAEYARRMRREFSARGLAERQDYMVLPFLGEDAFDKLRALYRGADFYLELSGHEGFGMQLVEAMATGTTCISSGRGALTEVGGTYVVPLEELSPDCIAGTLSGSYRKDLHRRSNASQVAYTARYDWDSVGELIATELTRMSVGG